MQRERNSEERTDLIVGIITVVVVLALFGWLLASISRRSSHYMANVTGEITTLGQTRRGAEQVFTYNLDEVDVMEGARVTWTINGERVYDGAYAESEAVTLAYTPSQTGKLHVYATVGNYKQYAEIDVLGPRLTVTAPNVTIVYGDPLPQIDYTVEGFVDEDVSDFCYEGKCVTYGEQLGVGVYEIAFDSECSYRDYETEYVCGKLTVLPRKLAIANEFTKVYDGSNTIENPDLKLTNVVAGDDVCAKANTLYFDNKNAGCDKLIMLGNVQLVGDNACNYVLPDYVVGNITPKQVDVVGLSVKNKLYDGTTKADIDTMGTLNGVCQGDSVAIGSIRVTFEEAGVGEQRVIANGVSLIGADKDNYVVREIQMPNAEIADTASFWDKLLEKEPIALGNN